jgi:hypothetical protein
MIQIQRWNGGTLRRYRFPNGARLVTFTGRDRLPAVIPAWCGHISTPVSRPVAAEALRNLRKGN